MVVALRRCGVRSSRLCPFSCALLLVGFVQERGLGKEGGDATSMFPYKVAGLFILFASVGLTSFAVENYWTGDHEIPSRGVNARGSPQQSTNMLAKGIVLGVIAIVMIKRGFDEDK